MARSVARNLSSDASMPKSWAPASTQPATCQSQLSTSASSAARSATMNCMPWNSRMRWPDWRRWLMKATASSKAARAIPSAWAATLGRDLFSEANRIFSPSPGWPSKLACGTRQPSNASVAVPDARMPILSSRRSTDRPGVPCSRISTEMLCLAPAMPSHLPNSRYSPARSPLVMKLLPPLTRTSSPTGRNEVRMPVASEPASGSVMASAPRAPSAMRGSRRVFCSSLPQSIKGLMAWEFVAQMMPVAAPARLISRAQARQAGEGGVFLLFVAPVDQGFDGVVVRGPDDAGGRAGLADFADTGQVGGVGQFGAAVGRRYEHGVQAERVDGAQVLRRKFAAAIEMPGARRNLFTGQLLHARQQHPFLVGERKARIEPLQDVHRLSFLQWAMPWAPSR